MLKTRAAVRGWQQGISLLEAVIGMAIMATLVAASAPGFSTFMQNRTLRNAADATANGLNLAKAEAVRRNTAVQFNLGPGTAWSLGCVTQTGIMDATGADTCPATIQSYTGGSGDSVVAVTAVSGNGGVLPAQGSVVFNGFGLVPAALAQGNVQVDFTSKQGSCVAQGGNVRCLRVNVSAGGQIHECDPSATSNTPTSTTNAQAC